jgi:hypothetical protein
MRGSFSEYWIEVLHLGVINCVPVKGRGRIQMHPLLGHEPGWKEFLGRYPEAPPLFCYLTVILAKRGAK